MSNALPSPYLRGAGDFDPPEPDRSEEQFENCLIELGKDIYESEDIEIHDTDPDPVVHHATGDVWIRAYVRIPKELFTHE